MKHLILIIALLAMTSPAWGADWYVRPLTTPGTYGGEDGTTYADAWNGFQNIVWGGAGVVAGDTLYVAGTHHGKMTVGASGTVGSPITITAYGSGATISGATNYNTTAQWTSLGSNLWATANNTHKTEALLAMFGTDSQDNASFAKASFAELTTAKTAWWDSNNKRFVVYSTSNPATAYGSVWIPEADVCLYGAGKNHISVSNLTMKFATSAGLAFRTYGSGITVDNCDFSYISGATTVSGGAGGVDFANGVSHAYVTSCTARQCLDVGFGAQTYGASGYTMSGIRFENNISEYNGNGIEISIADATDGHVITNCTISNNTIRYSGYGWGGYAYSTTAGKGISVLEQAASSVSWFVVNDNVISDYASFGIYLAEGSGHTVYNNEVYNGTSAQTRSTSANAGLLMHGGGYANRNGKLNNTWVHNNVIYNNNCSGGRIVNNTVPAGTSLWVVNNTFYNNGDNHISPNFESTASDGTVLINNIFWQKDRNYYNVSGGNSTTHWSYANNNIYGSDSGVTAVRFGGVNYTMAQLANYKALAALGGVSEQATQFSDPLFLSPSAGNYRVLRTSPAIDAGTNDADGDGITDASGTDLGGTAYPSNGTRDIGAYEYDYQLWSVDSKKFRGIP